MDILMLGLFSFGGSPSVTPTPDPPKKEDPEVEEAKKKERELARRRKGRSSTILTGPQGLDSQKPEKTLLGQ